LVPLFAAALFRTGEDPVLLLLARNLQHTMQTSNGVSFSGKVLALARQTTLVSETDWHNE